MNDFQKALDKFSAAAAELLNAWEKDGGAHTEGYPESLGNFEDTLVQIQGWAEAQKKGAK